LKIFTQSEETEDISKVMAHTITHVTKYHKLSSANLTTKYMDTYDVAEYNRRCNLIPSLTIIHTAQAPRSQPYLNLFKSRGLSTSIVTRKFNQGYSFFFIQDFSTQA